MMLILLCIPVILWTFSLSRTMQTFKKTASDSAALFNSLLYINILL